MVPGRMVATMYIIEKKACILVGVGRSVRYLLCYAMLLRASLGPE